MRRVLGSCEGLYLVGVGEVAQEGGFHLIKTALASVWSVDGRGAGV